MRNIVLSVRKNRGWPLIRPWDEEREDRPRTVSCASWYRGNVDRVVEETSLRGQTGGHVVLTIKPLHPSLRSTNPNVTGEDNNNEAKLISTKVIRGGVDELAWDGRISSNLRSHILGLLIGREEGKRHFRISDRLIRLGDWKGGSLEGVYITEWLGTRKFCVPVYEYVVRRLSIIFTW